MGVYIKDMQMPKTCGECEFFAWKRGVGQYCAINNKITFHVTLDDFDVGYKRNGTCPLVLIPSHGDLIDREALIKALHAWFDDDEVHAFEKDAYWHHGVVMKIINEVPTILPAEESEMDKRGCPPDYNGGFCADYNVDCKACWEQWEQEHKVEESE